MNTPKKCIPKIIDNQCFKSKPQGDIFNTSNKITNMIKRFCSGEILLVIFLSYYIATKYLPITCTHNYTCDIIHYVHRGNISSSTSIQNGKS